MMTLRYTHFDSCWVLLLPRTELRKLCDKDASVNESPWSWTVVHSCGKLNQMYIFGDSMVETNQCTRRPSNNSSINPRTAHFSQNTHITRNTERSVETENLQPRREALNLERDNPRQQTRSQSPSRRDERSERIKVSKMQTPYVSW